MSEQFPLTKVSLSDTKTELACSAIEMILHYLRKVYGQDMLEEVVKASGMNLDYLANPKNWISLDYCFRLLDCMVELTDNEKAPYEAGTYSIDPDVFGPVRALITRLGTVADTYRLLALVAPRWNKVAAWKYEEGHENGCVLSTRIFTGHKQTRYNCDCIKGATAAVPRMFGLPMAQIDELACQCDGAPACVYKVTWRREPHRFWRLIGFAAGGCTGLLTAILTDWTEASFVAVILIPILGFFAGLFVDYAKRLGQAYRQSDKNAEMLTETMEATEKLSEALQKRVEERTEELQTANSNLEVTLRDLKDSQEKLVQSERRATLGLLAAGMAHELNNPLTAVKLGLQNLKGMMKDSEQAQTQFRHAESAAQRCGRIVNDLLALSREPHLDTSVHLETVVQKTIAIFRQEFSGNVTVETVIASSLPPVSVDRIQIQQALMNVLINAFEAMKGKGVITVSVSDENRQIAVRIKNSGPGVPDHILSRVFEPFFTTKEMGKGSGLGLAITAQLVQKNGGTVAMEKSETGSVVFLMRFPAGLTVDPNPSFRDSYVILSSDKAGKEE